MHIELLLSHAEWLVYVSQTLPDGCLDQFERQQMQAGSELHTSIGRKCILLPICFLLVTVPSEY